MKTLVAISCITVFLLNCESTPISVQEEEPQVQETVIEDTICSTAEDCDLQLTTINAVQVNQPCQVYDFMLEIEAGFIAPAGLQDGSKSRIDWEFLPNGNAGFWVSSITNASNQFTGVIENFGCFSFGEQDSLKITQTITDQDGVVSNEVTYTFPRSSKAKSASTSENGVTFNKAIAF